LALRCQVPCDVLAGFAAAKNHVFDVDGVVHGILNLRKCLESPDGPMPSCARPMLCVSWRK
jgi:hypothetical protein